MQVVRIARCSSGTCGVAGHAAASRHICRNKHAAWLKIDKAWGDVALRYGSTLLQAGSRMSGYADGMHQRMNDGEISFVQHGREWAALVLVESRLPCGNKTSLGACQGSRICDASRADHFAVR